MTKDDPKPIGYDTLEAALQPIREHENQRAEIPNRWTRLSLPAVRNSTQNLRKPRLSARFVY
jgi:hypothetical protein